MAYFPKPGIKSKYKKKFIVFLVTFACFYFAAGIHSVYPGSGSPPGADRPGLTRLELTLNGAPITLAPGNRAISQTGCGWQILTFHPLTNHEGCVLISYGGIVDTQDFLSGTPVVYSYIKNFSGNYISVTNTSSHQGANIDTGYFGLGANPTYTLPPEGGKTIIDQYESVGFFTPARTMTVRVTHNYNNSVIFIYVEGNREPLPIALNTDPDDLPLAYTRLPNLIVKKNGTCSISKNWKGKAVFIVNTSLVTKKCKLEIVFL